MNTYIYVLKLSERLYDDQAWTTFDNEVVNDHFMRIKKDFESGKILHVGRTEDPTNGGFGLVVFKAKSLDEALLYMNTDPAVIHKQMTATLYPYKHIL